MYKSNFMKCGSQGAKGDNGITPHIGANKNWYIGDVDTGVHAEGKRGMRGFQGEQGEQGIQGIQGEKGEKGDSGNKIHGIKTIFHFTETVIKEMSKFGYVGNYNVTITPEPAVGDVVYMEILNDTTKHNYVLVVKITEITGLNNFRATTIGSIKEPPYYSDIMICSTDFEPHTSQQIDDFSQLGHTESFDITHIHPLDTLVVGQQIGLLIPNSDIDNNSLYFGQITNITESSVVCDSIGCIHGGARAISTVFVVPANGTFKDLKVKASKRKNTVMVNLEVNLLTEPNIGETWFTFPEGFRPIQGTSVYTILGGAIIRSAIMPDGTIQMIEKISGTIKTGMDYTVTFNYVID